MERDLQGRNLGEVGLDLEQGSREHLPVTWAGPRIFRNDPSPDADPTKVVKINQNEGVFSKVAKK